jgi:hypothetical protein
MIDTRLGAYLIWGVGTVIVYSIVLWRAHRSWKRLPDRRARRDLIASFALFLTALASFLAITAVLFGTPGSGLRGFAVAMALGGFFGAGLILASPTEDRS